MDEPTCAVALHCIRPGRCILGCAEALLPPPVAVKLCLFRSCSWQSESIATAPGDVQDEIIARHLLRCHEEELRTLGRFAEEMELL